VDNGCALSKRDKTTSRRDWTTSRKYMSSEHLSRLGRIVSRKGCSTESRKGCTMHSEQQRVHNSCALSRRDKSTSRRVWTTSRKDMRSEQVRKDCEQKRLQYKKFEEVAQRATEGGQRLCTKQEREVN
jgi:hypothetical protein